MSWRALCKLLTQSPPEAENKDERGWFCPVEFVPPYRDSENFYGRHALTFDFDEADETTWGQVLDHLDFNSFLMYTTFSHTAEKPRFRLVLPLSRVADYDEFQAVSRKIGEKIGIESMARESHVPSQMMYLPTVKYFPDSPADAFKFELSFEGEWIDVDATLASYEDWTDHSSWPHRRERDGVHKGANGSTPPNEKEGPVGDFCRVYDIPAAILAFDLPYTPTASADRWTYTAGSRPEGAVLYDEGQKLQSHHDTDPARGQHNAFDLVRLHNFSYLDGPPLADLPMSDLPSYRQMLELIAEDPAITAVQARSEYQAVPPDEDSPLERSAEGGLAVKLAELLENPTKPRWLIRDELERGVIAVMAGPRGSYKSFLALDWAMRVVVTGAPVYVVSAEGADFDRRAKAWLNGHDPDLDINKMKLYVAQRRLNLARQSGIDEIREDCKRLKIKPQLIVLDTFSKLSGGLDENDNTAVKQFIGRLDLGFKRDRDGAFDATVLVIAHTGHSDANRPRGASAFAADTDAEYIVARREGTNVVSLSRERFKSSAMLPPLAYESEVIDLGYVDDDGEAVTSLVMRKVDFQYLGRAAGPKGHWEGKAFTLLNSKLDGIDQVPVREIYKELAGQMPPSVGEKDTRLEQARKIIHKLVGGQFCHVHGDYVSLTTAIRVDEEFAYLD